MKQLLFLLTVCFVLAGCGHSAAGKYVNTNNPANTLELKGDGTFTYMNGGNGLSGTYTMQGSDVTMTMQGLIQKGTLNGDKITTGSSVFTKQ